MGVNGFPLDMDRYRPSVGQNWMAPKIASHSSSFACPPVPMSYASPYKSVACYHSQIGGLWHCFTMNSFCSTDSTGWFINPVHGWWSSPISASAVLNTAQIMTPSCLGVGVRRRHHAAHLHLRANGGSVGWLFNHHTPFPRKNMVVLRI